jgi:hypothetical protein
MDKKLDMKQTTHPNFILGIVSFLILFIGIGLKFYSYRFGDILLIGATVMGGIHWIWSIIDVIRHQTSASQSRKFWLIMVIIVPAVGSMCYYMFSKTMRM